MIDILVGPNLVSFGTFVMSWHGFFSFVAVASAVYLIGRWAPMNDIDPDDMYSVAIWAILGGILGARAVHVIDNWGYYGGNPGQIIAIWTGGIGMWGGVLGGLIGGVLSARKIGLPIGLTADTIAPSLLFAKSIGRLGDIVNGEHCAKAWDFALGFIWRHPFSNASPCTNGIGVSVQPVIAYEMIWNMLALIVIWKLRGRLRPAGMLFVLYLALYSIGRFGVTFMREDRIWALGLQQAQYIALIVLAVTVPLLLIKARPSAEVQPVPEGAAPLPASQRGTRAQRRRRGRQ